MTPKAFKLLDEAVAICKGGPGSGPRPRGGSKPVPAGRKPTAAKPNPTATGRPTKPAAKPAAPTKPASTGRNSAKPTTTLPQKERTFDVDTFTGLVGYFASSAIRTVTKAVSRAEMAISDLKGVSTKIKAALNTRWSGIKADISKVRAEFDDLTSAVTSLAGAMAAKSAYTDLTSKLKLLKIKGQELKELAADAEAFADEVAELKKGVE